MIDEKLIKTKTKTKMNFKTKITLVDRCHYTNFNCKNIFWWTWSKPSSYEVFACR